MKVDVSKSISVGGAYCFYIEYISFILHQFSFLPGRTYGKKARRCDPGGADDSAARFTGYFDVFPCRPEAIDTYLSLVLVERPVRRFL